MNVSDDVVDAFLDSWFGPESDVQRPNWRRADDVPYMRRIVRASLTAALSLLPYQRDKVLEEAFDELRWALPGNLTGKALAAFGKLDAAIRALKSPTTER